MLNEKKTSIICHSIAAIIIVALMILLCFKNSNGEYIDLAINHALSNSKSFFGIFFMIFGEYPAYLLIPIGGTIFYYNSDRFEKGYKRILWKVFSCVLIYAGILCFALMSTKMFEYEDYVINGFGAIMGFVVGALLLGIGYLIPKETHHKLFKFAIFIIVFTLAALLVTRGMKAIWSRMRYRDMLKEGNFDGFTPWFLPQIGRVNPNPDYHYTSFPSGHTSSACHVFVICLLPYYFKNLDTKKWKISLYVFSVIFTVLVAISRIVNNAHFLSDTLIGGGLTYVIFYVLKFLFFKNGQYEIKMKEIDNATI